jgi:hypothetical protein
MNDEQAIRPIVIATYTDLFFLSTIYSRCQMPCLWIAYGLWMADSPPCGHCGVSVPCGLCSLH